MDNGGRTRDRTLDLSRVKATPSLAKSERYRGFAVFSAVFPLSGEGSNSGAACQPYVANKAADSYSDGTIGEIVPNDPVAARPYLCALVAVVELR
jgi:hypothetical protein